MISKAIIDSFLQQKHIAVAGVSRNKTKFGAIVYRHMKKNGYDVYAINPNISDLEGDIVYPDVQSLPDEVTAIITVTKPDITLNIIKGAVDKGIRMVWMQKGSEGPEALKQAAVSGITTISGKCIMMFADPVKSIHRFHRFLMKLFGKYPA